MAREPLEVEEEALGGGHLIAARGEIDHMSARVLADVLRNVTLHCEGPVVLDLCETTFIDSAGISTLLNGLRRLTRQRRKMFIVCPPGPPRRVFELLGLVGTFDIYETREQALAGV
ncbi:MAG: anti-sigma factor antagonist [Thermoleophilaceae bacterium]|jgi:anti-anti-sigma factor|nr:anti-sigma factor antagonist [Thermoleophilaceae bacterium]